MDNNEIKKIAWQNMTERERGFAKSMMDLGMGVSRILLGRKDGSIISWEKPVDNKSEK